MKTSMFRALLTLCISAVLAPVCLLAQGPIRTTIPFDFMIGSKSFAAGEYVVRQDVSPSVLAIASADHRSALMTLTFGVQSLEKPGEGKLVFNRYGDQYFLSQVWTPGSGVVRQLPTSPAERELIAQMTSKPVTLVASAK